MNLDNTRYFILNDQDPGIVGGVECPNLTIAREWNQRGYGVFWTVNSFSGDDRLVQNLSSINSWFFELDQDTKGHQLGRIELGLYPSLVIESKNGFHCYFFAKRATIDTWHIIQSRLINYYKSDPKIKDPLRLLRAPGFYHMKNPSDPFLVKTVSHTNIIYPPEVMLYYFPPTKSEEDFQQLKQKPKEVIKDSDLDYFDMIYNLDHKDVLTKFSGTNWVSGERYTFKDNRNGKLNIYVNGKSTSCFIDSEGRIGAVGGGPTIWQWLRYFGHSNREIKQAIKEVLNVD